MLNRFTGGMMMMIKKDAYVNICFNHNTLLKKPKPGWFFIHRHKTAPNFPSAKWINKRKTQGGKNELNITTTACRCLAIRLLKRDPRTNDVTRHPRTRPLTRIPAGRTLIIEEVLGVSNYLFVHVNRYGWLTQKLSTASTSALLSPLTVSSIFEVFFCTTQVNRATTWRTSKGDAL